MNTIANRYYADKTKISMDIPLDLLEKIDKEAGNWAVGIGLNPSRVRTKWILNRIKEVFEGKPVKVDVDRVAVDLEVIEELSGRVQGLLLLTSKEKVSPQVQDEISYLVTLMEKVENGG